MLSDFDLENINKLRNYSNLLSDFNDNIRTGKNSLNSQISNSNLDNKDSTNETIYKKFDRIKFSIDDLTSLLGNMSTEAKQTVTKLTTLK